jgi:glutamate-1-semialdehyde 2,1-aminomutase
MERLRFVHTGSEAVHMCMRVARAFTGREKVGKFEGHYHGSLDNLMVSGGTFGGLEDDPVVVPGSAGIGPAVLDNTVALPFNNTVAMVRVIERHAHELASVVVEPLCGAWLGGVAAEPSFLEALRDVTERHGIVLIFDEVLTGFRLNIGGAAALTGITPDLTALAKAMSSGFPLGAFGGRRDIIDQTVTPPSDPSDHTPRIAQSGTFQSNLVSLRAASAAITAYEAPGVYDRLYALGDTVREGIAKIASSLGMPMQVIGMGPIYATYFTDVPIRSVRDLGHNDSAAMTAYHMGLLANGVFSVPGPRGFNNLSQSDDDIERLLEATARVLAAIKDEQ